jgi:hypothetical protein
MTRDHTCHATGCDVQVPPRMFLCRKHWFMLEKEWRDAVWAVYVPGQEERMDPTPEYLKVTAAAIDRIEAKEGRSGR